MHLLAATPGSVDEGQEPVDLGQSPADVVFISAADTELAALSSARADMTDPPGLRLASMMHLQHPMSVDLHIDACASRAKLVVARVLGGASYWNMASNNMPRDWPMRAWPLPPFPEMTNLTLICACFRLSPMKTMTRFGPIWWKAGRKTRSTSLAIASI